MGCYLGVTAALRGPFFARCMLSMHGCSSSYPDVAVPAPSPCSDQAASPGCTQSCSPHRALTTTGCPGLEREPLATLACLPPSLGDACKCAQLPLAPPQRPGQHQGQTHLARTVWLGVICLLLLRRGIVFVVIILRGGERVYKRRDSPAEQPCMDPSRVGPVGDRSIVGWWCRTVPSGVAGAGWGGAGIPGERRTCPPARPRLTVPAVPVLTARGYRGAV